MARLQSKDKRDGMPKPCEYFDMIAGTGTGGISAVMLGRLSMSIDDAISSYVRLMQAVFKRELKAMIRQAGGSENEKMVEQVQGDEVRCKVIVYAMSAYNLNSAMPILFRSYSSAATVTSCTIWEALRATTAHPQMFKPIEVDVDGTGVRNLFAHWGLGCTNPTPRLLEEARSVYPGRSVATIVSIGAGHPKTIQINAGHRERAWSMGGSMMRVMKSAQEMAEGSERVAEEMARRFADVEYGYYRLNVQQGTQGVEASDWERLDEVAAHTRSYLDQVEITSKLEELAEIALHRKVALDITRIDGRAMHAGEPLRDEIRSYPPSSIRFTGRRDHKEKVRMYFTSGRKGRYVFVIYGLGGAGGAGKTQIASKSVEQLQERFTNVIFVDASSDETIRTSLATIALTNNLGKTYEDMLRWISRRGQSCLLVLDNADDLKVKLQKYFPQGADYSVLITTRCHEFAALAEDMDAVCNASGLEEDESVELLLKTIKRKLGELSEADKAILCQLLKSFDYLALAIVQSGAYIWKMQLSISQYWDRYSTRQQKLPEGGVAPGLGLDGYSRTVYTTWDLSLGQLSQHAEVLLFLVSFLHRDGIIEDIFRQAMRNIPEYKSNPSDAPDQVAVIKQLEEFLDHFADNGHWNDAFSNLVGELMSFSLLTYIQESQSYSIHPLVQSWAQLTASRQAISLGHSTLLLGLSINWDKSQVDYAYKRRILPHVNLVVGQIQAHNLDIADRFTEVYRATGQFYNESTLWERTIIAQKQQLGEYHPTTLASMSSLGKAYQEQGKLVAAKELQEAALSAQIRILGEEHPDTLMTKHKLGWTYYKLGQYADAETLLDSVVAARKEVLGKDHPDTLESMDDLASTFLNRGKLKRAETLRMAVLAIRKQTLGEDHVGTLQGMNNLAATYQLQGRLAEAEALSVAVVDAQKRVLGEDHPDTLVSMHNLAAVYRKQDRLIEAEALYTAVATAQKRVLGEDHPDTLISIANLGFTYQEQGRMAEAEALCLSALATFKRVLGEDHPDTIGSMAQLATLDYRQDRFEDVEVLETALLAARRRILGWTHPHTIVAMMNLEDTYSKLGKTAESEALQKERAAIPPTDSQ